MITFLAIIVLERFLKDVLNVLIPLQFGVIVCKDFTSRYGKYELSGIVYIIVYISFSFIQDGIC